MEKENNKLNREAIEILRKKLAVSLADVPVRRKVVIDPELLDQLIFDEVVYNKETGETLKLPVWTGPFLKSVKLCDLSFEDVAWSLLVQQHGDVDKKLLDDDIYEKLMNGDYVPEDYVVDFSWTDAKIDFSKSFEAKKKGFIAIENANLRGTNLTPNSMSKFKYAQDVDFAYSGLRLDNNADFRIYDCNLQGVPLGDFTVDAIGLLPESTQPSKFKNCYLNDTLINIVLDEDSFASLSNEDSERLKMEFGSCLNNDSFGHCYFNNQFVPNYEERFNHSQVHAEWGKEFFDSAIARFMEFEPHSK